MCLTFYMVNVYISFIAYKMAITQENQEGLKLNGTNQLLAYAD
jgi:hypothetical protein